MSVIPVLELSDGRQLSQSLAIGRYLATMHGLMSKDPFENAWGDQLVGAIEDIYPIYYRDFVTPILEKDEEQAKITAAALKEKALEPLFTKFEQFLGDKKYFCGNDVHWSDLAIAELVDRIETILDKEIIFTYPKLAAHSKRIHDTPNLKKYIEKRPQSLA